VSKEKVKMSATDISAKWNRNTKNALPDVIAGVERVTENPAAAAIAKQDKMKANLVAAIDDGTWAASLSKVTLADWKAKAVAKIRQRLAGGVDGAMGKRQAFDSWLVGQLNAVLPTIKAMPDMTLQDSIARVTAMMEHMSANRYKGTV